MNHPIPLLAGILLLAPACHSGIEEHAGPEAGVAQQPDLGCLPQDGRAEGLRRYATRLVRDESLPYVETRQRYQIVASADAIVEIVTDEPTCIRAAVSFARASGRTDQTVRRVYVVAIRGDRDTERFMVLDPLETVGEFQVTVVFDRNFRVLAQFAS